jgi:hypothetical protein
MNNNLNEEKFNFKNKSLKLIRWIQENYVSSDAEIILLKSFYKFYPKEFEAKKINSKLLKYFRTYIDELRKEKINFLNQFYTDKQILYPPITNKKLEGCKKYKYISFYNLPDNINFNPTKMVIMYFETVSPSLRIYWIDSDGEKSSDVEDMQMIVGFGKTKDDAIQNLISKSYHGLDF